MKIEIILKMFREGKTFREMGVYFGVSRQRIHQLYKNYLFEHPNEEPNLKLRVQRPKRSSRNDVLYLYKKGAENRGLSWDLTDEEFDSLTQSSCFYCGDLFSCEHRANGGRCFPFRYNGIDRKNNKLGYTTKNCVSCCKTCNKAKHALSFNDWMSWLRRVSIFQNKNLTDC